MDKHEQMKQVRNDVFFCKACGLCKTRTKPVIGRGNHDAKILFIGEAPGENEDKTGLPFVGQAGQLLDNLLSQAGINNKDIYICNVLKCRPPENRDPEEKEKLACLSFLTRQIEIIQPDVIICLGKHAAGTVFKVFGLADGNIAMSKIHGKIFEPDDNFKKMSVLAGDVAMSMVKISVMYHPAALLYNKSLLPVAIEDFKNVKKYL
jgi:DNA polymerase